MAEVRYIGASRRYAGSSAAALKALDLDIADGEFMVLVGPSGSGKSTALRMLAGLEDVDEGEIRIGDDDVTRWAPRERDIAMVFQNYALYPHLSVADNMAFSLKLSGIGKQERKAKVLEAARLLDLVPYLDRRPKALSGGQRQRVAMGRAIVREPRVFLMDEPLSNLDAKLRVETRANIAALQARLGTTTVYVTHDQTEAMTMGHRVALLNDGELQQVDTPRAIYDRPANVFVAGFIGSPAMNLRWVGRTDGSIRLGGALLPLAPTARSAVRMTKGKEITVGLRPESFAVATPDTLNTQDGPGSLSLRVTLVEHLGADSYVHGTLPGDDTRDKPFVVRVDRRVDPARGETLPLTLTGPVEHVFNADSGRRLT
ncbi:ABC transporter ATP-binding protein [Pseudofrankia asymbiotica]|uniref:Sugar ABC transporter ATP-binding protein n=1 Tax=Pseudofrankia asymbiotica TaxID=1834516 RepID=A0A1V2IH99_9ACTN|nr:sn-glycerol-3-phosphate ABC transporter ATP-binding protein UgpC [Pseudofrankia asymbiotica]ONH32583.1 sugar ABC transporter ATP-binding protein [Pseudofrankia asymbiotica]